MCKLYEILPADIKEKIDIHILNSYKEIVINIKKQRSLISGCALCPNEIKDRDNMEDLTYKEITWYVRNRRKDLLRGHKDHTTILNLNFCKDCNKKLIEKKTPLETIGWDEWDAIDNFTYTHSLLSK